MRFPIVVATSLVCAFLSLGCKQDVGERCEVPSDCASGFCAGRSDNVGDPEAPHICTAGPNAPPALDADTTDAPVDAGAEDAVEAGGETQAADASSEVGDAASEAATEAGVTEAGGDADGGAGGDAAVEAATSG